jgi:RNA-binding protein 39
VFRQVRSCKLIEDRITGRTKGIAYCEFKAPETVITALGINGQRLRGAPIVVMLTQAEKNRQVFRLPLPSWAAKLDSGRVLTSNVCRQAAEKSRLEQEALTRLHIMGLPDKITEDKHLGILFESFGKVILLCVPCRPFNPEPDVD